MWLGRCARDSSTPPPWLRARGLHRTCATAASSSSTPRAASCATSSVRSRCVGAWATAAHLRSAARCGPLAMSRMCRSRAISRPRKRKPTRTTNGSRSSPRSIPSKDLRAAGKRSPSRARDSPRTQSVSSTRSRRPPWSSTRTPKSSAFPLTMPPRAPCACRCLERTRTATRRSRSPARHIATQSSLRTSRTSWSGSMRTTSRRRTMSAWARGARPGPPWCQWVPRRRTPSSPCRRTATISSRPSRSRTPCSSTAIRLCISPAASACADQETRSISSSCPMSTAASPLLPCCAQPRAAARRPFRSCLTLAALASARALDLRLQPTSSTCTRLQRSLSRFSRPRTNI
eukprot:comp5153_c0_seq1/m.4274 comp5153_c0_seq1/g.4274  ORF comp5153_c0_seq1/g.4274 comp5153_c0_seq1/m.4274 type:complete len:346 (-) comp5153_c0_seq1:420-1457(-)